MKPSEKCWLWMLAGAALAFAGVLLAGKTEGWVSWVGIAIFLSGVLALYVSLGMTIKVEAPPLERGG